MNSFRIISRLLNVGNTNPEFRQAYVCLKSELFKTGNRCLCSVVPSTPVDKSPLDVDENLDLSSYGTPALPSFNFAAYADKSELLQELIKLGVELYKIERNPDEAQFLAGLDYQKNVKPHLMFLYDNGVPADKLGAFVTKNPFIFKEDLLDLDVRLNYLKSKKFTTDMISTIITKYPRWLSFPVQHIDKQLGYLQQTFNLKGDHIRQMVTQLPRLVAAPKRRIMVNSFVLREEMMLDEHSLKKMITRVPSLLIKDEYTVMATFDYITKKMNIPVSLILKQPNVLLSRKFILRERHQFLRMLGRDQYNPLLPGYIPLLSLVLLKDNEFCEKIAKVSVETYNEYLKSL
ncbi:hypothetical protein RUM43_009024 [Polyplax serrata]|uniref:Transcription termination factor 3, mitochondrial n=1 Tax=Polyplax serrata TaxID=468196 RepID=A0AAN8NVA8_POLSC